MKVRLGDYIQKYSVRNKRDEDIPVYSVTNSKGFCQDYFGKEVASKDKSTYKIVPQGCFAYNPSRINVGSVDWQRNRDRVIVSPLYNVFSVSPDLDQQYLYYYLKSDITLHFIKEIATGSVRDNLRLEMLYEFPINLPGLGMQRQIVARLDMLSNIISLYREQIDQLDTFIKARFVEMFGTFPGNEKGWKLGTIRDVISEARYGTSRPAVDGGEYPYLRMNNITYGGELDLSDVKQIDIPGDELPKCTVRRGDVLFNRTNSKELVGKTCVYNRDEMMVLAGFVVRVRMNEKMLPEVLSAFLNTDFSKRLLFDMCKKASGQANINAQEMQNIGIYIPPIEIQKEFVSTLRQVDKSKFYEEACAALARHADNKRQECMICRTLSS